MGLSWSFWVLNKKLRRQNSEDERTKIKEASTQDERTKIKEASTFKIEEQKLRRHKLSFFKSLV